jgi:aquaporin Z
MDTPHIRARLGAEFLGTFWLMFGGLGTALYAANFPSAQANTLGVGLVGVALAFGLTVVTMAYAVGHVSGGHVNPAVTVGIAVAKRIAWRDVPGYIVSQVLAATVAVSLLLWIGSGKKGHPSLKETTGAIANGYGDYSPGGYSLLSAFLAELILTAFFLYVILGATDGRAPKGFAPLAIGLCLTLIHHTSRVDRSEVAPRPPPANGRNDHPEGQLRTDQPLSH